MNDLEVNFLQETKEGEPFLLNRIILIKTDNKIKHREYKSSFNFKKQTIKLNNIKYIFKNKQRK